MQQQLLKSDYNKNFASQIEKKNYLGTLDMNPSCHGYLEFFGNWVELQEVFPQCWKYIFLILI